MADTLSHSISSEVSQGITCAYFGNIRTAFRHIRTPCESLNNKYPLIKIIKGGPNNEEARYAVNKTNIKIKIRIRIITKRNRPGLQLWENNGIRDSRPG